MLPVGESGITLLNILCSFTLWTSHSTWTRINLNLQSCSRLCLAALWPRQLCSPARWGGYVYFAGYTVWQEVTFVHNDGHIWFEERDGAIQSPYQLSLESGVWLLGGEHLTVEEKKVWCLAVQLSAVQRNLGVRIRVAIFCEFSKLKTLDEY